MEERLLKGEGRAGKGSCEKGPWAVWGQTPQAQEPALGTLCAVELCGARGWRLQHPLVWLPRGPEATWPVGGTLGWPGSLQSLPVAGVGVAWDVAWLESSGDWTFSTRGPRAGCGGLEECG